jgi:hypothetical protein
MRRSHRRLATVVAASLLLTLFGFAGCSRATGSPSGEPAAAAGRSGSSLWTLTERGAKTELILKLKSPPDVIVLGGSRALRFQPSYIHRLTGLTAFNAAVIMATPEDDWAFANLFHSRFPRAHFRFLWIIHVDEFDEFAPNAGLLADPFLSCYLPRRMVSAGLNRMVSKNSALFTGGRHPAVLAPDGFTISDGISAMAANGSTFQQRIHSWLTMMLRFYSRHKPRIDPMPDHFFRMTLELMNDLGDKPVIVLAPMQPEYYAAVYNRGWEARHQLVLSYLRGLQKTYRFSVLDFSKLSSIGGSPAGFYDAVHLRPNTARLVVRAILRDLPHAFAISLPFEPR